VVLGTDKSALEAMLFRQIYPHKFRSLK